MDKYFSVYTVNVNVHKARPIFPTSVFHPEKNGARQPTLGNFWNLDVSKKKSREKNDLYVFFLVCNHFTTNRELS